MSFIPPEVQDLITLVTNIALVISLFFLIYQIYLQRREMKYSTYEKLNSDFSNTAFLLVEHPELTKNVYVGENKPKNWEKYDEGKKVAYSYFDALLGLFERAYTANREIGLSKKDWNQWGNWIKELATNPIFVDIVNDDKKKLCPYFHRRDEENYQRSHEKVIFKNANT